MYAALRDQKKKNNNNASDVCELINEYAFTHDDAKKTELTFGAAIEMFGDRLNFNRRRKTNEERQKLGNRVLISPEDDYSRLVELRTEIITFKNVQTTTMCLFTI